MKRGARGAESSGVLLARLINARAAVTGCREALRHARAAGAGEACRRLRAARASLGGVVRHLERLHAEANAREFRERQGAKRCGWCGATVWPDGRGAWVDNTGGDGCGAGVHAPEWSGGLCPVAPDQCWIDDVTGEHVNARTGARSAEHRS